MDFAVCPACGQSVLEDDAENCPFCGSSMKAKPGAKPPAKAAAVAAAPAKSAAKVTKASDDDLPFDAEAMLPQTAIQVSATPSKSRTLKVICPMCDTAGYVAPSAAGKSVKCANPKCHVPIFTAPAPKVEAPPPPPPPSKRNPLVLGAITAVVVLAISGVIYVISSRPSNSSLAGKPLTPEEIAEIAKKSKATEKATTPSGGNVAQPEKVETPINTNVVTSAGPSKDELIKQMLHMFEEASLLSGSHNRSKPFCRRLAAEGAVLAGNIPEARKHLDGLIKVGPEVPFYRIGAQTEMYWLERGKGNSKGADEALNQAAADSAKLPKLGRDQLDLATQLAAALVAAGRQQEARDLIKAHQIGGMDGDTSAYMQIIAHDAAIIDPRKIQLQPVVPRQAPQAAATTALLVLRGEPAAARTWATGWDEPHIKAECLTALVESAILGRSSDLPASDITALTPANQVLLWSRAARRQAAREQLDAAKESLAKTAAPFEALKAPAEFAMPDAKGMQKWKPTSTESLVTLAAASAELAVAQQVVAKDTAAATKALELSMQACRAIGPATGPIQALNTETDGAPPAVLRQKMKTDLDLKNDDQARQALTVYRQALSNLSNASQQRFNLQITILSRAAQAGLEDAVWGIVSARTAETDSAKHEPYYATDVAGWLVERFRARGANDMVQTVTAAAGESQAGEIKRPPAAEFDEAVDAGKFKDAVAVLQRTDVKPDLRESLSIAAAIRLAGQDPVDKAWQFIGQLPPNEIVIREVSWEYAGMIAARRHHGAAASKQVGALNAGTEKIALGRGLIAGLQQERGEE